jgi:hypothetical protein
MDTYVFLYGFSEKDAATLYEMVESAGAYISPSFDANVRPIFCTNLL